MNDIAFARMADRVNELVRTGNRCTEHIKGSHDVS